MGLDVLARAIRKEGKKKKKEHPNWKRSLIVTICRQHDVTYRKPQRFHSKPTGIDKSANLQNTKLTYKNQKCNYMPTSNN
jgi:hypothetical protein